MYSFVISACRELFGPLYGEKRELFIKEDGISFIVVRDPFERLVSAYFDKISKNYTEKSIEWETFGEIQVHIKENYRKIKRGGLIPTFEEFAEYVATNTTVLTPRINNHWKPIFYNCAPCIEKYVEENLMKYFVVQIFSLIRYMVIMKMETLSRDSQYLKVKVYFFSLFDHF